MIEVDGNAIAGGRDPAPESHSTMLRSMAWARSWTALVRSASPKSITAWARAGGLGVAPEEIRGVESLWVQSGASVGSSGMSSA